MISGGPPHRVHGYGVPAAPEDAEAPAGAHVHHRFSWPDEVFAEVEAGREVVGLWTSHDSAEASVMLEAPAHGSFVRVLLPVRLDDGGSITYGVWWRVTPEAMRRADAVWTSPEEYPALRLDGELANDLPPGGALGARGTCVVRDPDHTPYVDDSTHPLLARLLAETWSAQLHP